MQLRSEQNGKVFKLHNVRMCMKLAVNTCTSHRGNIQGLPIENEADEPFNAVIEKDPKNVENIFRLT